MNITLNGKSVETDAKALHALPGWDEERVVILNGYQTNDDLPLKEGDTAVLIRKGELPPEEAFEAMLSARHTPGVYEKVKAARVAVAGLGGLGSSIALHLARTGIGHLHLIDFDVVEPSNLNRQQYRICHLGIKKAEALKQEIADINPFIEVRAECVRLNEENAAVLLKDDEIVCEAFDDPVSKAMLVNTLLMHCPQKYVVASSGMAGYESGNTIRTHRAMNRLYMCGDGFTGAQPGRGLMAPRVAICAGHQANMALRILLGETDE